MWDLYNLLTNKETILHNNGQFFNSFEFNLCDSYIEDVLEFLENEYNISPKYLSLCNLELYNTDKPILLDFISNEIKVIEKYDIYYKIIANNLTLLHPDIIITNASYLKCVILMVHLKYKFLEGYNYILYRFTDWAWPIIVHYTTPRHLDWENSICPFGENFIYTLKTICHQNANLHSTTVIPQKRKTS